MMTRWGRERTGRVGEFLGSALLNVAAVGGLLCIVLVVLAFVFNITLVMFKTGSMGPTIPAGSIAVVREIPASEVNLGDVVTVARENALPITHRVVHISEGSASTPGERLLTLKGDANTATDAAPYRVETVRLVLFSLAGVAAFVVWLSNPMILFGITLAAAVLVTWAFWPRRGRTATSVDAQHPQSRVHGRRRLPPATKPGITTSALGALIVVCSLGAVVADPPPAAAAPSEQITGTAQLRLISIGDPVAMNSLMPGVPVHWQVGAWASAASPGVVDLELTSAGSQSLGLWGSVRSCEQRWVGSECGRGEKQVKAAHALAVGAPPVQLARFPSERELWLLFDIWMPSAPVDPPASDRSVQLSVHATGLGEQLSSSPGEIMQLPVTGLSATTPLFSALGAVAVGLGCAAIARFARTRRAAASNAHRGAAPRGAAS